MKEANQKKYIQRLESEAKNNFHFLREKFLHALLQGTLELTDRELEDKLNYFKIGLRPGKVAVVAIEIDRRRELWQEDKEQQLWSYAVWNISGEIALEYSPSVVFQGMNSRIFCIMDIQDASGASCPERCLSYGEKVRAAVKEYLNFTVTVGVGGEYSRFEEVPLSCREAVSALEEKFFKGCDRVISGTETKNGPESGSSILVIEDKDDLLINLRIGEREAIVRQIERVFERAVIKRASRDSVLVTAMELISAALAYIDENGLEPEDIFQGTEHYLEALKGKETLDDMREWTAWLVLEAESRVSERRRSRTSRIVERAKEYIEANYFKPALSLDDISASIYVNPSYLSKVFKKELQVSIIEYLTDCRLKKAKELIDGGICGNISDAAEKVGYSDPYYFSKSFKKQYGIAPSRYLERKSGR